MVGSPATVACLLARGADPTAVDAAGRTPADCAQAVFEEGGGDVDPKDWDAVFRQFPDAKPKEPGPAAAAVKRPPRPPVAGTAVPIVQPASAIPVTKNSSSVPASAIEIDDRVLVNGNFEGRVRFRGPVSFDKAGDWIGVQLDTPNGKNNGEVAGVAYFRCKPKYGIFVRARQVQLIEKKSNSVRSVGGTPRKATTSSFTTPSRATTAATSVRRGLMSASKLATPTRIASTPGKAPGSSKKGADSTFGVGSKVMINRKLCTVQFIGEIEAKGASGAYIGVELPDASGQNDGSLEGKRYFRARPNRGLFTKPERCTWRGIKVSTLI